MGMGRTESPVIRGVVAGSVSGFCSTVLFQPLDLIKTKVQCSSSVGGGGASMVTVVRSVVRTDRVFGLWRGIVPSITRTVPGVGIHFGSLHLLRTNFPINEASALQSLLFGMSARCVAGTTMIPITVIKTRFESGNFKYRGISSALVSIYRTEGVRGLKCGLVPTLIRDAPFSGLYLMFYTRLKIYMASDNWILQDSSALHFSCGIVAGVLASAVTHPADVIKTNMQLKPKLYQSSLSVVEYVWKEAGLRGMFAGCVPRMLRRSLMSAFTWTVYERLMKQMGLH